MQVVDPVFPGRTWHAFRNITTSMRKLSTVATVLLLAAFMVQGQPKGRGGGYVPKNLQVLDKATFPNAMQSYVQALGLADQGRCNYCHVAGGSTPLGTAGIMSATASRQATTACNIFALAAAHLPPKQLWRSMLMRTTSLEFSGSLKLTRVSAYS